MDKIKGLILSDSDKIHSETHHEMSNPNPVPNPNHHHRSEMSKNPTPPPPAVVFSVYGDNHKVYWFLIKTGSGSGEEEESRTFVSLQSMNRLFPGATAVGSTLYALGGLDSTRTPTCHPWRFPLRDVFYIDTLCPEEGGWKKLDHPMNTARYLPYAFTVNGKIYVMGGHLESGGPKPEVLDTNRIDEGWRELRDSTDVPVVIHGHAVLDGGKRIVVVSHLEPNLCFYDVEADSWHVCHSQVSRVCRQKSAFVDGILYYLDERKPGVLFGVDVSKPDTAKPKRVRLPLDSTEKCEDWERECIPQPPMHDAPYAFYPNAYLVPLGMGKLAAVWTTRDLDGKDLIFCSTMRMCKEKQEDGDFEFEARALSLSEFSVRGTMMNCLAVFPYQRGAAQEDVTKDDNTISAQEDSTIAANEENSTGGSNKKKSGMNKNKNKNKS